MKEMNLMCAIAIRDSRYFVSISDITRVTALIDTNSTAYNDQYIHVRTVPMPVWVKAAVDRWLTSVPVTNGRVFRAVSRHGIPWGTGISENVVWYVVRNGARRMELDHLAPHDLRRTCAKLCHVNGGELEQIQFLLGHASVLTTERYLGCKQNLEEPVNDRFGSLFSRSLDSR
jgi:integrase